VLLTQFQYELPPERIAQFPPSERTDARLLELNRNTGTIQTAATVATLVNHVKPGDCWVINDTRVRPARVGTRKPTGGYVELLVLGGGGLEAEALYRASKPLKAQQHLQCEVGGDTVLVQENLGNGVVTLTLSRPLDEFLNRAGRVPLPPYIPREPTSADQERYQTVYANEPGAVAAPTAGLHFTPSLMKAMTEAGATFARVTLHVGPGTFRPIRTADIRDHEIHSEQYRVTEEAAERINNARRVVAVGTTAVRVLESVATQRGRVEAASGETDLYIQPGFDFRVVNALLTNFHLPESSLLVLVAAFCGLDNMHRAYQAALENDFRFYSYGDAMFLT